MNPTHNKGNNNHHPALSASRDSTDEVTTTNLALIPQDDSESSKIASNILSKFKSSSSQTTSQLREWGLKSQENPYIGVENYIKDNRVTINTNQTDIIIAVMHLARTDPQYSGVMLPHLLALIINGVKNISSTTSSVNYSDKDMIEDLSTIIVTLYPNFLAFQHIEITIDTLVKKEGSHFFPGSILIPDLILAVATKLKEICYQTTPPQIDEFIQYLSYCVMYKKNIPPKLLGQIMAIIFAPPHSENVIKVMQQFYGINSISTTQSLKEFMQSHSSLKEFFLYQNTTLKQLVSGLGIADEKNFINQILFRIRDRLGDIVTQPAPPQNTATTPDEFNPLTSKQIFF